MRGRSRRSISSFCRSRELCDGRNIGFQSKPRRPRKRKTRKIRCGRWLTWRRAKALPDATKDTKIASITAEVIGDWQLFHLRVVRLRVIGVLPLLVAVAF